MAGDIDTVVGNGAAVQTATKGQCDSQGRELPAHLEELELGVLFGRHLPRLDADRRHARCRLLRPE